MSHETMIRENDESVDHDNLNGSTAAQSILVATASDRERKAWIEKVADVCAQAANGNLEARILGCDREDDIGRIVHAVNHLLDITDAFVREAKASLEYASRGKFFRRVLLRGLPGTFRGAARTINGATEEMARGAGALEDARRRRLELADNFESAVQGIVDTVASASTELSATAQQLSNNATSTTDRSVAVSAASEQMSVNVERVAAATEELSNTVAEVSRQAVDSSNFAAGAVKEADNAHGVAIGLSEASTRIGGVVKLISQIAGQTNLLALNATIEAARAGEAGKGFAVVASEVKGLARQTAEATEEIQKEIAHVQEISGQTVQAIDGVGGTIRKMREIAATTERSAVEQREATQEICNNIHQASLGTQEVNKNISGLTGAAQETSASASHVLLAAGELSEQSEKLRAAVDSFLANVRAG